MENGCRDDNHLGISFCIAIVSLLSLGSGLTLFLFFRPLCASVATKESSRLDVLGQLSEGERPNYELTRSIISFIPDLYKRRPSIIRGTVYVKMIQRKHHAGV
ncbi:hypothetical protein VNO80_15030 [Phaseolus coccineus]|uniref:Uncharacterized protein n=1 Tax=Phaseolus coccineus TaxID=3886 RepID=A0AAN9MP91_PHACN